MTFLVIKNPPSRSLRGQQYDIRWPVGAANATDPSRFVALNLCRVRDQPIRQWSARGMINDVLPYQLPDHLRRGEVLRRADLLEDLLLSRVDQDGQTCGSGFHRWKESAWHVNQVIIAK